MMKAFLISGLLSGSRFKSAARGYDKRKEPTSFTATRVEPAARVKRGWGGQAYTHLGRRPRRGPDTQTLGGTSSVSGERHGERETAPAGRDN